MALGIKIREHKFQLDLHYIDETRAKNQKTLYFENKYIKPGDYEMYNKIN